MHETVRLGRIRGIPIGAHWSVLVIGWLLVWALADDTFPTEAPGAPTAAYWGAALVIVCCFWGALAAHEVAHSLVATRLGVRVDGITLWLFGGVSRLHGEAADPRSELRIALAGPATSFAIALGGATVAAVAAALGGPDLVVVSVGWLAAINGLLAVFNLLPGAPLDGGRVLHAMVWARTDDRARATRVATAAGRSIGYALIAVGVLLVTAGALGGIWFAFLGWFLLNAARAEATHVLVRDALAGVRVRDVMTAQPRTAPADISVAALLDDYLLRHHCSAFPLLDDTGRVVAFVTLRHVRRVPPHERAARSAREAGVPMTEVPTTSPDEPVLGLFDRLGEAAGSDGRALVFEGDHLVGIVTPTDLNRALELARLRGLPTRASRDRRSQDERLGAGSPAPPVTRSRR